MLMKSMVGSCGKSQNNCRQSWPKGENSQAGEERRLPGTWRTKDAEEMCETSGRHAEM